MPAEECNNGKWKWGETGECKYETQEEAEKDNEDYYENEQDMKQTDKRHIKKVIEDDDSVTIVFGKSEEWEGVEIDTPEETEIVEDVDEEETEEEIEDDVDVEEEGYKLTPELNESQRSIKIWDKKYNNTTMEKRVYNLESRLEKRNNGKEVVVGYGSIFNSRSENLGGFYEFISPEAISEETINNSDVRALINHDPNLILARSQNGKGNLKLSVDEKGLRYEYEMPDLSYAKDLSTNLKNGNITQSSFAFTIDANGETWETDEEGRDIRTITKIDRLYDISSVTYPAYSDASSDLVVAQRSLSVYKQDQENKKEENDLVMRSLAKLKIELIKRKNK